MKTLTGTDTEPVEELPPFRLHFSCADESRQPEGVTSINLDDHPVVTVDGGPSTGKTSLVRDLLESALCQGAFCIAINLQTRPVRASGPRPANLREVSSARDTAVALRNVLSEWTRRGTGPNTHRPIVVFFDNITASLDPESAGAGWSSTLGHRLYREDIRASTEFLLRRAGIASLYLVLAAEAFTPNISTCAWGGAHIRLDAPGHGSITAAGTTHDLRAWTYTGVPWTTTATADRVIYTRLDARHRCDRCDAQAQMMTLHRIEPKAYGELFWCPDHYSQHESWLQPWLAVDSREHFPEEGKL